MKIFDNPKGAVYLIVAFLVAFFLMRSCEAEASEATIELGPTFTSQFNGGAGLVYTERLAGKWDLGVMLVSDQTWDGISVGNNGGLFGQRIVSYKKVEMGLGVAGWIQTSRIIGCHVGFTMMLRYNITPQIPLTIRHWSNAGTCDRNRGQDLLTIGWRFK